MAAIVAVVLVVAIAGAAAAGVYVMRGGFGGG